MSDEQRDPTPEEISLVSGYLERKRRREAAEFREREEIEKNAKQEDLRRTFRFRGEIIDVTTDYDGWASLRDITLHFEDGTFVRIDATVDDTEPGIKLSTGEDRPEEPA